MASGEQSDVDVEEAVGEVVPHHQSGLDGQEVRGLGGVFPYRVPSILHVGLSQRKGYELDVPVRPPPQSCDQMLVGVAGERAAVVVGDRERELAHIIVNAGRERPIPGGAHRPSHRHKDAAQPSQEDPEDRPRHHVGGMVEADVDPAEGDRPGHGVVGGAQRVVLGQQCRRAPGGEGVARRKARRPRDPNRQRMRGSVRGVAVGPPPI